jgi:hypothetical protein
MRVGLHHQGANDVERGVNFGGLSIDLRAPAHRCWMSRDRRRFWVGTRSRSRTVCSLDLLQSGEMANDSSLMTSTKPGPRRIHGVMVSSTYTDLELHRAALVRALKGEGLTDVAMENDPAKAVDLITSSLQMVRDASAYIAILSHKYGQTPESRERNPLGLSITELEFEEAQRLGRPILLFLMGEDHPVRRADVETDPVKCRLLREFRERAKRMAPDSEIHRVYQTFNSLEEFEPMAIHAMAELRRHLEAQDAGAPEAAGDPAAAGEDAGIPTPPTFYAEPPYIGSHQFVGRAAQLTVLNGWAAATDPCPVLLFDAIGGSGKSMLTWHWVTEHAADRNDWAGRIWYSFYERGAVMADFCRCALAYMTGRPLEHYRGMKSRQLQELLYRQLKTRPWLLILDGIERVLVAYHRLDAAQVSDEEASRLTDQIARRDPCASIRPDDDDLLHQLAAVAPSKTLITSRLMPRALLNRSGRPLPGVAYQALPGLDPKDAELLLRSCGVTGKPAAIQSYLQKHCGCHALVTGALAGLINDYLPDRGNFDAWETDDAGGGKLDLANLDLTQKRNHILKAALEAVSPDGRELLSLLAVLSEAVDFPTLTKLNPFLPPEPLKVAPPYDPRSEAEFERHTPEIQSLLVQGYEQKLEQWEEYSREREAWLRSEELRVAPQKLGGAIRDLERRGLLQYDGQSRRYDLHPVVRSIAASGLRPEEKSGFGQRILDHFSSQAHRPYMEAESLEEVRGGIHIVRTLLSMGRIEQAYTTYRGALDNALLDRLEAYAEALALLRPFFPQGWDARSEELDENAGSYLVNSAAIALERMDEPRESLTAHTASLLADLAEENWVGVTISLTNISRVLRLLNRPAAEKRCLELNLKLAKRIDNRERVFFARLYWFSYLARLGRWEEAEQAWEIVTGMGRDWSRTRYQAGTAEFDYALYQFWRGKLSEVDLEAAAELARKAGNRRVLRGVHGLRGHWQLRREEWAAATESLTEAVTMARTAQQYDAVAEAQLAQARFRLGELEDPIPAAGELSASRKAAHLALAELWEAIGDRERARQHAATAYHQAWADGEPYVHRWELDRSRELLTRLGAELPKLISYQSGLDEDLPWEHAVEVAIRKRWPYD